MTYNYPNMTQPQNPQVYNNAAQGQFQQNVQPLFPQPQGNVYNINSTLEVANVPVGAGISVALCLNEGFMYIKSMQNGNPLFWAYKITPYDNTNPVEEKVENPFEEQFKNYDTRFANLEQQVETIQKSLNQVKGEWKV